MSAIDVEREARYAEAIHGAACGAHDCDVCIRYPEAAEAARAYQRRMDRAQEAWRASDRYARIRSCKHENRRPNPSALPAWKTGWKAEICNDCGIGYARRPR